MIQASTITFLQKGKNLLALSGGVDSMVLAHLLIQHKISFECAHVNFGLRGSESDEDEEFVKQWAKKNNIVLHVNNGFKLSKNKKETLQEQARAYRYQWFEELTNKFGFHQIITAHHHTDNVENLFIQLLQGGSLAALKGIEPQRHLLSRPLLNINREKIERFANQNRIDFRIDSSNQKDDYLRNSIRHQILPLLRNLAGNNDIISPAVFDHLRTEYSINQHVAEQLRSNALKLNEQYTFFLKASVLNHFNPLWALFVLTQHTQLHHTQQAKLFKLISDINTTGKRLKTATHELEVRDDRVLIFENNTVNLPTLDLSQLNFEYFENTGLIDFKAEPNAAFLDADLVNVSQLHIRYWQIGDRFHPLGMSGSKLLSDFFVNQKMNSKEKEFQPLLCLNNEIVWVVNRRIDRRFAVHTNTKRILKISPKNT